MKHDYTVQLVVKRAQEDGIIARFGVCFVVAAFSLFPRKLHTSKCIDFSFERVYIVGYEFGVYITRFLRCFDKECIFYRIESHSPESIWECGNLYVLINCIVGYRCQIENDNGVASVYGPLCIVFKSVL